MTKRIPSLDGLRAISVGLVLLAHLNGSAGFGYMPKWLGDTGVLGVRIFFVISGFLITNLLLAEKDLHGRISLTNFYLRRAFRILPVVFAFIGVALLLGHNPADAVPILTFTANYVPTDWTFAHFWSLSVEEQFYVLWPLVLVTVPRRHAIQTLTVIVLLCPVLRLVHYALQGDNGLGHFELVSDALAFGCLLACCQEKIRRHRVGQVLVANPWVALSAAIVAWAANTASAHPHVYHGCATTISIVSIGMVILYSTQHAPMFLNGQVISWIGTLSYSLYIWQQLFLRQFRAGSWMNAFPWSVLLALAAASISYYFLEKPVIQFRTRMLRVLNRRRSAPSTALVVYQETEPTRL